MNRGLEHVNEIILVEFWLKLCKKALRVSFRWISWRVPHKLT